MYGQQHPAFPGSFSSDSWSPDGAIRAAAAAAAAFPFPELSEEEVGRYASLSSTASCMQPPSQFNAHLGLGLLNDCLDQDYGGPIGMEMEMEMVMERAFSHAHFDLHQGMNMRQVRRSESPLSSESNFIIECMSKACPYSPEEKKERIERYRSKRSLRNFNKKIKYECRKALADSRPRVRGRFAKNEESYQLVNEWSLQVNDDHEDEESWGNLLDSFSANYITP